MHGGSRMSTAKVAKQRQRTQSISLPLLRDQLVELEAQGLAQEVAAVGALLQAKYRPELDHR
eukprot:9042077-Pyramimonas_sp.AAC.1